MESKEIDLNRITRDGIDRLLRFLPIFAHPEKDFGTALEAVKTDEGEFVIQGGSLSNEGIAFLETCYEENFVQSFDWMKWVEENSDTVRTHEFVRTADLTQIVMLVTAHLRQDHFQNDHLYHKLRDGTIQMILERLAELRSEVAREHGSR